MLEDALARAESDWRRIVAAAYPLHAGIPVVKRADAQAPASFEAWTDKRAIHLELNRPAELEAELASVALPCWRGHALEADLPRQTFLVVLLHELYHPLVCPNGHEDEAAISRAICRGIQACEPALGAKELVLKVDHVKNLMWDVVVNVTLLARTGSTRRGIKPVLANPAGAALPVLYVLSAARGTTDALIGLAGAFYVTLAMVDDAGARDRALRILLDGLARQGVEEAAALRLLRAMFRGLGERLDEAALAGRGIDRRELLARADLVADWASPAWARNQEWLLSALDAIFDASALRYAALEGLARVLAPLVPLSAKQGTLDPHTSGGDAAPSGDGRGEEGLAERTAGSLAATLDDLADQLGPEAVKGVLEQLAKDPGGALDAATASAVQTFAKDALYKRTATAVELHAPAPGLALLDVGKQLRWDLVRSQDLSLAELAQFDLARLVQVQVATGLPMLLSLSEDRFKLNEFALVESPVRGWAPREVEAHLPDNWILLLDSSGSMCGAPFELLLRAVYGLQKGIYELCLARKRDLRFGVVNFSTRTVWSGLDSFVKVYGSHTHATKRVLFEQQNGGTELDPGVFPRIEGELAPGRTVYTLVTDGEIANEAPLSAEIERIARERDAVFLFLEISQRSELGRKLEALSAARANVISRKLDRIEDLTLSSSPLLVRYAT